MPVTIDTRSQTKTSGKPAEPPVNLSDFASPRDVSEGRKAFAIWLLIPIALGVAVFLLHQADSNLQVTASIFLLWWFAAAVGYLRMSSRATMKDLMKSGSDARITTKNLPRVYNVISRAPAMLGIKSVDGFLVNETVPQVRMGDSPNFLQISTGARDLLAPPELDCLALRSLVHIRQGHAGRLLMMKKLGDLPMAHRIAAWPVIAYAKLLNLFWVDGAEQTADRLTLLLIKNREVLLSSIIKLHAATDPLMQDAGVTPKEVDAYIKQMEGLGSSGSDISTQYKLGSAISSNPYLGARVEAISAWARSSEYREAVEKLTAARQTAATMTEDNSAKDPLAKGGTAKGTVSSKGGTTPGGTTPGGTTPGSTMPATGSSAPNGTKSNAAASATSTR